jgi:Xaa-Pro aminopeptidase
MKDGEIVYMDYGSDYEYYTSDVTRTWPVSGRFTPEQEKMYRCILEARDTIIAAMKPGVTISQLQDLAEGVYTMSSHPIDSDRSRQAWSITSSRYWRSRTKRSTCVWKIPC